MHQHESLIRLLRSLPGTSFLNEAEFIRYVMPALTAILGYRETEVFYEYGGRNLRADAVFAQSVDSIPWLVVELKMGPASRPDDWVYQIKRYLAEFSCDQGIVLSPSLLITIDARKAKKFELATLTDEQGSEILRMLARDKQGASVMKPAAPLGKLGELIEKVECASTNDEKGKSLEAVARLLVSSLPALKCKYSNLQTRSSEIDVVVEYDPENGVIPLFEEFGRYCLIECKNWSKPVGVSPVRDFMGKLDKCKIRLGVIFSKNGVTGVDSGVDALREIQSRYDRDGVLLLVFSLEDVKIIKDGAAFAAALDQKADHVRFDIDGG